MYTEFFTKAKKTKATQMSTDGWRNKMGYDEILFIHKKKYQYVLKHG